MTRQIARPQADMVRHRSTTAPRMIRMVLCAALLSAAWIGTSQARQGEPAVRQACQADMQSLCAGVQPGGGRKKACMQQNADKLSQACKDAVAHANGG